MTVSSGAGTRAAGTRRMLMDATAAIMIEEGCTAATSRRVAARAGVRPALVHYYFPTMDDLHVAVLREGAEANMARLQRGLTSERPLRALWEWAAELRGSRLLLELMTLAGRREAIRVEIATWSERFREVQVTALGFILRESGMDTDALPPAAIAFFIEAIGRMLVLENLLGVTAGHADGLAVVERFIDDLEKKRSR